ncbi:MAG: hypothetical protein ABI162_06635 [Luteolibacter sp.]
MKTQNSPQSPPQTKPSVVRRLGLGAFSISLLVHGLFALIAVLFLYKWVYPPTDATVTPPFIGGSPHAETQTKIKTQIQQTMPVSYVDRNRIVIPGVTDYTVPEIQNQMADGGQAIPDLASPSPGTGMPGGLVGGHNAGPVGPALGVHTTPFGTTFADGSLPGHFYDFKQTAKGKPTEGYNVRGVEDYASRVIRIQKDGFREAAFRKFFQAPDALYLTQLAIPTTDADAGPKFFNVADKVKPSGWLVVYDGSISTNRDMTFRFLGTGDDYISVFNNSQPKLINAWPDMRQSVMDHWKPSEAIDNDAPSPLPGAPLVKGDWITLRRGQKMDISIAIGERPGGKVGFVLMVEEKGVEYRTGSNGAKVLPLFTTQPITKTSRDRITKDFPNWEFQWDGVPVFAVDQTSGMGSGF